MQLDIFLDAYPIFNDYFLICFIIQQEKKNLSLPFFSQFSENLCLLLFIC